MTRKRILAVDPAKISTGTALLVGCNATVEIHTEKTFRDCLMFIKNARPDIVVVEGQFVQHLLVYMYMWHYAALSEDIDSAIVFPNTWQSWWHIGIGKPPKKVRKKRIENLASYIVDTYPVTCHGTLKLDACDALCLAVYAKEKNL